MNSPEGSWVIYLSKPTHQQHQLLMNVASGHGTHTNTHTRRNKQLYLQRNTAIVAACEHPVGFSGVIETKDVLDMLGEIRKSLDKVRRSLLS